MRSPVILFAVLFVALIGAPAGSAESAAPPSFTWSNPLPFEYSEGQTVPRWEIRDPCIVREGDRYWLVFTMWPFRGRNDEHLAEPNGGGSPGIALYSSPDLKTWKFESWLVRSSELPADCPYKHRFWAPEIHKMGGKFYLIFTADNWTEKRYNPAGSWGSAGYAFVGVADRIAGPYEHITYISGGACDTTLFEDTDGRTYAFIPAMDLFVQEIDLSGIRENRVRLIGERRKIVAADNSDIGMKPRPEYLEGPWALKIGGKYVLFFAALYSSENFPEHAGYWTGAAYAESILGPWKKDPRGQVFHGGHLATFEGPDGRPWFSYRGEKLRESRGYPCVDRFELDAAGTVRCHGPTLGEQTVPLPAPGSVSPNSSIPDSSIIVRSPDGEAQITLELEDLDGKSGVPVFDIAFRGRRIVEHGRLGLDLADGAPLTGGLRVAGLERRQEDRTVEVFPGKTSVVRERFEEADVTLEELGPAKRRLGIVLRAYGDGVAFRYRFPLQAGIQELRIAEERTSFAFPGDSKAYALPLKDFTTPYENYYSVGPLREAAAHPLIGLPLLLELPGPTWAAVTEADLTDHAGLYLKGNSASPGTLEARLSPLPGRPGLKVETRTPHVSPWRVVMLADAPGRLLESNLVLALNEPCALAETSWIRPGKTTFPWWNGYEVGPAGFRGGLDTRTMLHYIDFCAEHGIPYHSLDGLDNVAWYGGTIVPYEGADITKSLPSIDLPLVIAHAKQKGVRLRLWMHWEAARQHMDRAFPIYESWCIEGVMVDFLDRDDQEMVRFEHRLVQKAAEHHLTVTLHGIHKPTGIQRTYPNLLTYEGVLNLEYDKWSPTGSSPDHELLVPFTRMLAGPLDYHQGGFRAVRPGAFRPRNVAPLVMGTRARMLAMYVVYEDPLPMMADYPEAYHGQRGLDFVVRVPTVWDETRVLEAEVGHLLAVARRRGNEWYAGAMTDGAARELSLPLSFLGRGDHAMDLLTDPSSPTASPNDLVEEAFTVDAATVVRLHLAPAGGAALRLAPASGDGPRPPRYPAER